MNHAEFHAAVAVIAGGRYFSTNVEASTHSGRTEVEWRAYIDGRSWTRDHGTPEQVLAELREEWSDSGVEGIGESPAATEALP